MNHTTNPQDACPNCSHPHHLPGTECQTPVHHGPNRWHLCLCLARPGAALSCPPQMTCQGGTLGYADVWYLQHGHTLLGEDGTIAPAVFETGVASVGFPSGPDISPPPSAVVSADRATLRNRIAEALYTHNHPGWAIGYSDLDRDERDTYLARADAVLAVMSERADRATLLREAADIAESLRQFETASGARKSAQVSENVGILRVVGELRRKANEAEFAATPCSPVVPCEDGGEPCDVHERLLGHFDDSHELCPPNCADGPRRVAAEEQPAETQALDLSTLAAALDGLHTLIATSSRDWQTYRVDAWIWAVLCGWDCEQAKHDETCTHGALEETAAMHGWDADTVAKARRYRAAVRAVVEAQQPAKPWLSDSARIGRTLIWSWTDVGEGAFREGYRAAQAEARALLGGERAAVGEQPDTQTREARCAHHDIAYGLCIFAAGHDGDCFHERQPIREDDSDEWGDGLCDSEYPGDDGFVGQLCALPDQHFADHRRDERISGTSHTALLRWPNRERP